MKPILGPPTFNFADRDNVFETFLLFDKITFLTKFGQSWLHFERFCDPKIKIIGIKKSIKILIKLWIDF